MRITTFVVSAVMVAATSLGAQSLTMPSAYRDVQIRQLESQRRLLVAMIDSMPERLYRDAATPTQRDFASQVMHCVGAVRGIGARALGKEPSAAPDTAAVLNRRAALRTHLNKVYDWAVAGLKAQSDQARGEEFNLFGQSMPRWMAWDEMHQHNMWTAGQIVANFRKHGMAPPGFGFF